MDLSRFARRRYTVGPTPLEYLPIGLARQGSIRPAEKVMFLHTGGMPTLHAQEPALRGELALAD